MKHFESLVLHVLISHQLLLYAVREAWGESNPYQFYQSHQVCPRKWALPLGIATPILGICSGKSFHPPWLSVCDTLSLMERWRVIKFRFSRRTRIFNFNRLVIAETELQHAGHMQSLCMTLRRDYTLVKDVTFWCYVGRNFHTWLIYIAIRFSDVN